MYLQLLSHTKECEFPVDQSLLPKLLYLYTDVLLLIS